MARGHFDRVTGGYVEVDRERRRREVKAGGWAASVPWVDVEYFCEWCGTGTCWDSYDFYTEHGAIPLTVDQARAHEEVCCEGDKAEVLSFTVWGPGSLGDGEPLLNWYADDHR